MDYFLLLISCLMLWLIGNKSVFGPIVGILNQGLWAIYALYIAQYELLLYTIVCTGIYARNLTKRLTAEYKPIVYMNPVVEPKIRRY